LKRAKTDPSLESGPMREGFSRYIVWGPESQERACESLKGPISLAIDVLFFVFLHFQYFQQFLQIDTKDVLSLFISNMLTQTNLHF